MSAKSPKLLSEYEAAAKVGMSPTLLRWFVSYAPRPESERKLQVAKKQQETLFFDESELLDFNAWLTKPWGKKDDPSRPGIPKGIVDEIKREANGECAICKTSSDKCEAAHIEPFAKSFNHHPLNLLWLCSNHHTAFDKNLFDAKESDQEFVGKAKQFLHLFGRSQWANQHTLSVKAWEILRNFEQLEAATLVASTPEQKKAARRYAELAIKQLKSLGPVSFTDPNYVAYQTISTDFAELQALPTNTEPAAVASLSQRARRTRQRFATALGYVACPLCNGSGSFKSGDCPVCESFGEIPEKLAENIDVTDYQDVTCPLCKGKGLFKGEDCPECGGERSVPRFALERFDSSQYQIVDCPVCEGSGKYRNSECLACGGEARLESRFADTIDPSDYKFIDCPLCEGSRKHKGDDCPACGGEGEMESQLADRVDLRDYDEVTCPVCNGDGKLDGEDCPACGGEGSLEEGQIDRIDQSDYDMVECSECDGKRYVDGSMCDPCDGTGKMRRYRRDWAQNHG